MVSVQVRYGDIISMLECFEADYSYWMMRNMFHSFRGIPEVIRSV